MKTLRRSILLTRRKIQSLLTRINIIRYTSTQHLSMNFDTKLRWKKYIKNEIEQINVKYWKIYLSYGAKIPVNNRQQNAVV